eukprot:5650565-Prymnesium_polylepis.1
MNSGVIRVTTPRAEWIYVVEGRAGEPVSHVDGAVVEGRARHPSHATDATEGRADWTLRDFAEQSDIVRAGLMQPGVAGVRLYTGPMYKPYNAVLRGLRAEGPFLRNTMVRLCCPKDVADRYMGDANLSEAPSGSIRLEEAMLSLNRYTTTLHAINSGIVKLSKLTKATTVYRGVNGVLPDEFWEPNDDNVMGGVELGFMSTSTEKDVALGYVKQANQPASILLEIRMGMIDRGADVSCLSQFPAEREILFAPLTGLE